MKLHKDGDIVKIKVLENGVEKVYDLPLVRWDRLKVESETKIDDETNNIPYNNPPK